MSIPDDPFSGTNPVRRTQSPPILHMNDLPSPRLNPVTDALHSPLIIATPPEEYDDSPSARHSSLPQSRGGNSGDDTGRASPTVPTGSTGGSLLVPDATKPGHKTPRRVQWTSDSHMVSTHQIEPLSNSPSNTIDHSNIDQVHAALERHQSQRTARRRPPSMLSHASSVNGDTEGEDYDYRLDIDPPIEPMPAGAEDNWHSGDDNIRQLLDNGLDARVSEYIAPGETDGLPNMNQDNMDGDHHDAAKNLVRAHTGKWGVLRRRVKGAGAVSKAFGGNGQQRQSENSNDPEKTGHHHFHNKERDHHDAFAARYPAPDDEDADFHNPSHRPIGGGGGLPEGGMGGASVLSSLLALYGQQNGGGNESGATSAASSRPSSDDGYSDGEDDRRRAAFNNSSSRRGTAAWVAGRKSVIPEEEPVQPSNIGDGLIEGEERVPLETIEARSLGTRHHSKSTTSLVNRYEEGQHQNATGIMGFIRRTREQIDDADRPKAARSGAGVFGALLQNTANLSGVATPVASALAPAAKRPGFQLNRFELPDSNAALKAQPWRPPHVSRPSSRAGSRPGSIHSSTAVSGNGSPDTDRPLKKNLSHDDVYSMRTTSRTDTLNGLGDSVKKEKRPKHINLDSLHKLPGAALKQGGQAVMNAEKWVRSGGKTPLVTTPPEKPLSDYFTRPLTEDERRRKEWESEKKRRKKAREARKKQEIFIIQHVAAILSRQQFLMKLARALMMFGSPSHRLETQIQATAKVLELNAQVVYLPGTILISFGDDATHTSETKFLKQATGLDLGKLLATHNLYWNVVHDKMSVEQASKDLDILMTTPVYYNWWQTLIIGAFCSAFICVIGFNGSFIDALASMPLGMLLVAIQMLSARNDMFSNVFEIVIATLVSFIAAALASTGHFCYTALVSGGVVLILPGYIVLTGALELASRNITAGSVRIGYSVIYSLFLGFGVSIGGEFYRKFTGQQILNPADSTCYYTHSNAPWYQQTPSGLWWILCAPGFSFFMSLRNQQPLFAKELPVMVLIACGGWASNKFSQKAFPNRSDMTSAIGSFVVGTLGNIYGRFSNGSSFPVTVVGILFQLPSGLGNGGIFNFAQSTAAGEADAWAGGFQVAQQLVSVAIGLTVGLFVSAVVTHPFGGGRKRGSGIFSF